MSRPLFLIYSLVIYVLGVVFAQKTISAILWFLGKLKKPLEFVRSWADVALGVIALVSLGHLAYKWWPLSNEHSQVLIFSVTAFTLFFQAFIGNKSYRYRIRPRPEIEFDFDKQPLFRQTIDTIHRGTDHQYSTPTYYIKIRIKNNGKSTLRNTAVTLETVKKSGVVWENSTPLGLQWTNTEPKKNVSFFNNIPQGTFRTIDLFKIQKKEKKLRVCSVFPTASESHILGTGDFELVLSVDSENAPPIFARLHAVYNGDWEGEKNTMLSKKILSVELEEQGFDKNAISSGMD